MMTAPVTRPPQTPATLRMTPGRWVALAIGVPIALAFIGWTGFSLVALIGQASFPVNATIPVHGGHLAASLDGSDITVRQDQVKSGNARLTGTVQYSLIRPRFTVAGSDITLGCRLPTGNCGLNATLDVPPATAVQLTTGGGNMQVSGIQSDVTLDSGGGDVTVSGMGSTANVSTGGGNVSASDLGGILKFSTGGGDLTGNGLFAPRVTTDSGGGNVTLVFTKVPASLDITSSGGDITIMLPQGSARYDITSRPGGGSYSASVPADSASGHKISVDSGGGNITIAES